MVGCSQQRPARCTFGRVSWDNKNITLFLSLNDNNVGVCVHFGLKIYILDEAPKCIQMA